MLPGPRSDEAIMFMAFFDAGLRLLSVELLAWVLRLYGVDFGVADPQLFREVSGFRVDHVVHRGRAMRRTCSRTCTTVGAS